MRPPPIESPLSRREMRVLSVVLPVIGVLMMAWGVASL